MNVIQNIVETALLLLILQGRLKLVESYLFAFTGHKTIDFITIISPNIHEPSPPQDYRVFYTALIHGFKLHDVMYQTGVHSMFTREV